MYRITFLFFNKRNTVHFVLMGLLHGLPHLTSLDSFGSKLFAMRTVAENATSVVVFNIVLYRCY